MKLRVVYSFDKDKILDEDSMDLLVLDLPPECFDMDIDERNAFIDAHMYDYKVDIYRQSLVGLIDICDYLRRVCVEYGLTPYLANMLAEQTFDNFNTIT